MGLQKEKMTKIGIPVNYHHINSITSLTHACVIIEVCSYINKAAYQEQIMKRQTDEEYYVYEQTTHYRAEYDPDMNIVKAYNYLKTLPEFEGAEDDDEEVYLNTIKELEENTNFE